MEDYIMTLDELIIEGENFHVKTTAPSMGYKNGFRVIYQPTSYIENGDEYTLWVEKSKRYIAANYPNDRALDDFVSVTNETPSNQNILKMVGILKSLKEVPDFCPTTSKDKKDMVLNISQSQTQNQQQNIDLVVDLIKDALTGSLLKEIKAIAHEEKEPEKAKSKIMEKLKGFGGDVLSNIVANLITNPTIWSQFI